MKSIVVDGIDYLLYFDRRRYDGITYTRVKAKPKGSDDVRSLRDLWLSVWPKKTELISAIRQMFA